MSNKQILGQFYTTNYNYILQNCNIPKNVKTIIEPFVGQGDLLKFINNIKKYELKLYDIEPKIDNVEIRNTLRNPPNYNNGFIITNPPYLARNKSTDKSIYDLYNENDLYKCFIANLLTNKCLGGILIIPLNFWCSIRKNDIELRKKFLSIYKIVVLNIFEERVFDDTSYTVCSFQFELINNNLDNEYEINTYIYPSKKNIKIKMKNNLIGGELYNLSKSNYKVERWTKKNRNSEDRTNLLLKCLDDSAKNIINLKYCDDENKLFIDDTEKLSARSYATLVINPSISEEKQKKLEKKFNEYLKFNRDKYNSLFLTNYRESKPGCSRKRISFKLAFDIVNHLLIDL